MIVPPITASPARAHTLPSWTCQWQANVVPVYFNPGLLAAHGYDVDGYRQQMINALAIWNQEANADLRLSYGGDTDQGTIGGAIVVNHHRTRLIAVPWMRSHGGRR